ncbi:Mitochondrial ribosome small subunit biogenesis protein [Emydomyces testavorans]|uniref:Mitochondrial ribosome small subunit biogenesis protein n=1 Tax=Emydomyces testavorans TaxID=2070801 RepID=A0AAF0DNK9_9EURO|nr:Mitochondrial ribosome small subunit biogenesis protein [Emydomyces testavorans]
MIAANSRSLGLRFLRCSSICAAVSKYDHGQLPRWLLSARTSHAKPRKVRTLHTSKPFLSTLTDNASSSPKYDPALLPVSCPGCGALTQWVDSEQAGYYTTTRKAVKAYIREALQDRSAKETENELSVGSGEAGVDKELGVTANGQQSKLADPQEALPIPYPPVSYIRDIMQESPWDTNHVYHILDAADFPLSLLPNIHRVLSLQSQRSTNRRAKTVKFQAGKRQADVHFIITRSDLLGGLKEHVDSMMAYMIQVLRDALGPNGEGVRLGNVHMVSAYRGWWTKEIKEKIWQEGGGVWMVGKTNVGKSNLISAVFPKSPRDARKLRDNSDANQAFPAPGPTGLTGHGLLPPAQKQYDFPILPVVSPCAGTTASPIRIPFGHKRGEVIDLPGLFRAGLPEYVQDKHKLDLIMTKRPKPERLTIKPGQSLVLGGLIRITPVDGQDVILATPFVALEPHITSTTKAVEMLSGQRTAPYTIIAEKGAEASITSAGIVELKYDVTKTYGRRLGQSSHREDKDRPPLWLIMSVDVLIEGCGWVELMAQVRTKNRAEDEFPKVEIFSPDGRCVGSRRPMKAYWFIHEKRRMGAKKAGRRRSYR